MKVDVKVDMEAEANGWTLRELPTAGIEILLPDSGHIFPEVDADPLAAAPHPAVSVGGNGENGGIEPQNNPPALAVSDLQTLLECPLRYWLQRKARLEERSPELATAAEWGSLTHKFWERVWRRFGRGGNPFPEAVEEEWRSLSSADEDYEIFGRLIRDRRLARTLEVLRFRIRRLTALQAQVLERLEQGGFRHRAVLLEEDAALSLEVDGVRFSGRCDRVEILEDGDGCVHAVITDYKAGRSVRYEEGMKDLEQYPWYEGGPSKLVRGLQLSAYALMYGPREADAPLAGVNFLGHRDGGIAGTFSAALQGVYAGILAGETKNNRRTLDERREEAGHAMACAARLLKEGRFAPFYDSPSCRYCDMKSICRRGETIGEPLANEEESADE
ncbi:MAG: RecB family exonuclease, partial [Fretibacterium sp.]